MTSKYPEPDVEVTTMERQQIVTIPVHVIEPVTEFIRCVRLATGLVVYEFSAGGKKISRVAADVYDAALEHAREQMQDEPRV